MVLESSMLKISSNDVGYSNDENNFLNEYSLTNTKVLKFCKACGNNSPANIKLSKTQLYKIGQSGGFSCRFFTTITKKWIAFNEK